MIFLYIIGRVQCLSMAHVRTEKYTQEGLRFIDSHYDFVVALPFPLLPLLLWLLFCCISTYFLCLTFAHA